MKKILVLLLLAIGGTAFAISQHWLPLPQALARWVPGAAEPAMYKWRDGNGHWVYGNLPPAGVNAMPVVGGSVSVISMPKAADVKSDASTAKAACQPSGDSDDDGKVACPPAQMRAPALERMGLVDAPKQ